jgi:protease-4
MDAQGLSTLLQRAGGALSHLAASLPGQRPEVVVVELSGSYPARRARGPLPRALPTPLRETSLEELTAQIERLTKAPWLKGVLFRVEGLSVGGATAEALRSLVGRLRRAGKRTSFYLTRLDLLSYFVASAADEVVLPESAELSVFGLALETTFMRDALARYGVAFEKLALRDYKTAGDTLVRQEMSPAQREQYGRLLESLEVTLTEAIAASRGVEKNTVKAWFDEGVTSAARALELGMIDRVAYEDELTGRAHQPLREAARFFPPPLPPLRARKVAVIALEGAIVTGRSRRLPLPLPLVGGAQAGAETLLRAFRAAEADDGVAAVVFYVNSGGGSALASDLIWREVVRLRRVKPVVAVMGEVAASGGFYVLTHADHVIAGGTTLTGSIGVLTGKFVLEEFNRRYGFHPEAIQRGRFALAMSPSHPFTDDERALQARAIAEVYARFVSRVAEGRKLPLERVEELAGGRVWTGRDAHARGLVDELGDLALGVARAREIAGLPEDAPVWNVPAPAKLLLPRGDKATWVNLYPWREERALLWAPLPSVRF